MEGAGGQRRDQVTQLCLLEADRGELWVGAPQGFTRTQAFLTGGKNNVIAASCTTKCSPPVNVAGIGS